MYHIVGTIPATTLDADKIAAERHITAIIGGGQIRETQLMERFAALALKKGQEQSEGISVRRESLRAYIALLNQIIGEESLNQLGESFLWVHFETFRAGLIKCRAVTAKSCDAAVKYQ